MSLGIFAALAGALGLGVAHAFEVDHMTAVTTFVARRPTPRAAASFGIQWAIGHGVSLLLLGSLLFVLKLTLADSLAASLERLVGVALLGLGGWTLYTLLANKGFVSTHRHDHGDGHGHSHGSLWMGMLHGAAGTAAFVGETLIAVSQTYALVVLYTLAFSAGVLIAMAAYAGALGRMLHRGERHSTWVMKGARAVTGCAACIVGLIWLLK